MSFVGGIVKLKFDIPRAELEAAWLQAAQPIAETPGLLWRVWLMNESDCEAGGIYLFDSEEAAQPVKEPAEVNV